jgi:Tol biopolymer transport system component
MISTPKRHRSRDMPTQAADRVRREEGSDMRTGLIAALVAALAMTTGLGAQQKPQEVALQAAIRTETVSGDLKKAIAQYQDIVDRYSKADRAVAANALVRMAECHQKLGDAQATKLFERVLREFADQKPAADVASARLKRPRGTALAGIVNRQVWTGGEVDPEGTISPDGRYLSFVDWSTGDLAIRDLIAGTNRRLTNKGGWSSSDDFAEESAISRDGTQVAYSWFNGKNNRYEVRVIRADAPAGTNPRTLFDNPDVLWIGTYDWSPDGKLLAVQVQRKDRTAQIGLVNTTDGSFKALKSTDWRGTTRMFFAPDGRTVAYDLPDADNSFARDVFILSVDGSGEFKVAPHPASETIMGWSPDGRAVLFASDRAGSSGLWSMPVLNGRPEGVPTLVKADLGRLPASLGVTRAGALLYGVRTSTETLATASLDLNAGKLVTAPVTPFENYLSTLRQPDWSHDGASIVAVAEQSRGRLGLLISTPEGTRVRELSPAMGYILRPRWAPDGSITATGIDLKGRRGIYRIDAQSGDVTPIVIGEADAPLGQPAWLPDGKSIVFRRNDPNGVRVVLRDVASGRERLLVEQPALAGLSLSPDGRHIAYIAQDRAARTSSVNIMALADGTANEVARLSGAGVVSNATVWTPDGQFLLFGQRENDRPMLYVVPRAGGAPKKLDIGVEAVMLRFHPDGRRIVYNTGVNAFEIWTLENFLPPAAATSTRR